MRSRTILATYSICKALAGDTVLAVRLDRNPPSAFARRFIAYSPPIHPSLLRYGLKI